MAPAIRTTMTLSGFNFFRATLVFFVYNPFKSLVLRPRAVAAKTRRAVRRTYAHANALLETGGQIHCLVEPSRRSSYIELEHRNGDILVRHSGIDASGAIAVFDTYRLSARTCRIEGIGKRLRGLRLLRHLHRTNLLLRTCLKPSILAAKSRI